MIDRERVIKQLMADEGVRTKAYRCSSGKLTIGVGRNLEDRGLTLEEIDFLFNNDINTSIRELELSFKWFKDLTPARKEVLVNMHFNMGLNKLNGFVKFINAMANGDYATASKEMLDSLWASQVGDRAVRLSKVILSGAW